MTHHKLARFPRPGSFVIIKKICVSFGKSRKSIQTFSCTSDFLTGPTYCLKLWLLSNLNVEKSSRLNVCIYVHTFRLATLMMNNPSSRLIIQILKIFILDIMVNLHTSQVCRFATLLYSLPLNVTLGSNLTAQGQMFFVLGSGASWTSMSFMFNILHIYRLQTKLREDYVFTSVCLSTGGVHPSMHLTWGCGQGERMYVRNL